MTMTASPDADAAQAPVHGGHANNLGLIRLFLAIAVIVGHVPYLMGREDQELLSRVYPGFGFGAFGVDLFFVISGYLITGSFLSSTATRDYLIGRVLRIYPAFVVASIVSVVIAVTLGGGEPPALADMAARIARLAPPEVAGAFTGTAYPGANGSMWTISYEFQCYLLVACAGSLGIFRHRFAILTLAIAASLLFIAQNAVAPLYSAISRLAIIPFLDDPHNTLRFLAVFGIGSCYRLFRDTIAFDRRTAAIMALAAISFMFTAALTEIALASLGGYAMFWLAFDYRAGWARRVNNATDMSYGIYLYAWPITLALHVNFSGLSIGMVIAATIVLASGMGMLSFHVIEQPVLRLKSRLGSGLVDDSRKMTADEQTSPLAPEVATKAA